MKHVDELGQPALAKVTIRVFNVDNHGKTTRVFRADTGKVLTQDGVDDALMQIADDLDRRLPNDNFAMVQVAPDAYNFVWKGKRACPPSTSQK